MQQTLIGCAFCDAPPGTETGEAHTGGGRAGHPPDLCRLRDPDGAGSRQHDHVACDGVELVVDTLAALTRFRLSMYWTRDLEVHLIAAPAE